MKIKDKDKPVESKIYNKKSKDTDLIEQKMRLKVKGYSELMASKAVTM